MFDPTEVYDTCPYSPESLERRLRAARVLSKAGIKCLVWAEDALAFVHVVPTTLFGLHLVVAEDDVVRASNAITASLPYEVYTPFEDTYVDSRAMNPSQPLIYPRSVHLRTNPEDEDDPETILIHPHSQVAIDLDDPMRSVTLPPFPSNILFPTRAAFIDCIVDHTLDPPNGRVFARFSSKINFWLAYFFTYTLPIVPSVLPNGDIEPERKKVLRALKLENQAYFEYKMRSLSNPKLKIVPMNDLRIQRKSVMEKLGKFEEARRPLPTPPPGPSEAMKRAFRESTLRATELADHRRSYSTLAARRPPPLMSNLIRSLTRFEPSLPTRCWLASHEKDHLSTSSPLPCYPYPITLQNPKSLMKIIPSVASLAVYYALSTLMTSATPMPITSYLDVGESRPLNSRNIHDATALLSSVAPSEDWFAPTHHLRETCARGSLGLTPTELQNPRQTIDNIERELMTKEKGSEIMTLYRLQISLSVKAIEIAIEQANRSPLQLHLDFVNFHGYILKAQMSQREPKGVTKADQEQLETTIHSCTGSVLEVLDRNIAAMGGVGNLSRSVALINLAKNIYIGRLLFLVLWALVNERGKVDVVVVQRLRETYRAALNFRKYFSKVHGLNGQMSQSMTLASEALEEVAKVHRGSEKKPGRRT